MSRLALPCLLLAAVLAGATKDKPRPDSKPEAKPAPARPVTYRTTPDGAVRGDDGSTLRPLPGGQVREPEGGSSRRLPDGTWRHADGSTTRTLPDGSLRTSDGVTLRRLPDGSWSGSDGTRIRELPGGQVRVTPPSSGEGIDPSRAVLVTQPGLDPSRPKDDGRKPAAAPGG